MTIIGIIAVFALKCFLLQIISLSPFAA